MKNKYLFEYCQKLVLLNKDLGAVLLAKRKGEQDYDETFTFIGGKMEGGDLGLIDGLKREKDEEIGASVKLLVYPAVTNNILFTKASGQKMILPHYAALFAEGEIVLSAEYSEWRWVPLDLLESFEPKIDNIPVLTKWAVNLLKLSDKEDLVEI